MAQSMVRYHKHNMFSSPSWGGVARLDMPPQSLGLSAIYSDDYLKVTEEPHLCLQTRNLIAGLNKGRLNIAKLAEHHVVVGMRWTEKCAHI